MSFMKIAFLLCLGSFQWSVYAQSPTAPESNEVAPGIKLPGTGTLFAVDQLDGSLKVRAIHASEILANSHAAGNFARSMVYAGPHASVEVSGEDAALSLHTIKPIFYMRLSADDPETMRSRVTLVRLTRVKDRRVVVDMSQNIFGGQRKRRVEEVPLSKSDVGDGSSWVKLTPQTPLEADGEYALVFMPKDPHLFADTVYDFGIAKTEASVPRASASKE